MDLFSINTFLSLTKANDVLQTELSLTNDISNFCSSEYKFPEDKNTTPRLFLCALSSLKKDETTIEETTKFM